MKRIKLFEEFIAEKREDVGKYNTVKKVVAKLGRRPSEQELAQFITDNYYDVTEVERGEDDPRANDKIADLVAFYKFDIDDWEIAWADAQNESVVTEARAPKTKEELISALDDAYSKLNKYNTKYYEISTAPGGGSWSSNSKEGKQALRYKKMANNQQSNIWKWTDKLRNLGFEYNTNESVVTEAKMPNKYIGNDEIVFLKTKEDSKGANYNLYYKGHDIERGGVRFRSEKELKSFANDYILSNQWYNKLKYEDAKPLPESFLNESEISEEGNVLNRLADGQVGGVPATEFQEEHNLDLDALKRAITYTEELTRYELRDIIKGIAPKTKIKRFLKEFARK